MTIEIHFLPFRSIGNELLARRFVDIVVDVNSVASANEDDIIAKSRQNHDDQGRRRREATKWPARESGRLWPIFAVALFPFRFVCSWARQLRWRRTSCRRWSRTYLYYRVVEWEFIKETRHGRQVAVSEFQYSVTAALRLNCSRGRGRHRRRQVVASRTFWQRVREFTLASDNVSASSSTLHSTLSARAAEVLG